MRSTFYCQAQLREPWALEMPVIADSVSFHVVTTGSCWIRLPGADPVEFRAGDLALVPHGRGHELLNAPAAGPAARVDLLPQRYFGDRYSVLEYGGTGRITKLICGVVSFDEPAARELMRSLPAILSVDGDALSAASSIRDTLRLMAGELAQPQLGGETIATRLADILVVQAIRGWLTTSREAGSGWLSALQDPRVGKALEAMHADPGRDWTLEEVARTATMSRSAFSARFTALVGEAPIAYLTRWRMNVARTRLSEEQVTAAQLASDLGYHSEAAFNRAFTRVIGRTPGSIRRSAR